MQPKKLIVYFLNGTQQLFTDKQAQEQQQSRAPNPEGGAAMILRSSLEGTAAKGHQLPASKLGTSDEQVVRLVTLGNRISA